MHAHPETKTMGLCGDAVHHARLSAAAESPRLPSLTSDASDLPNSCPFAIFSIWIGGLADWKLELERWVSDW